VVELFETRKPHDPAVISEIDGMVQYGDIAKGQRKIEVEERGRPDDQGVLDPARRPRERAGRRAGSRWRAVD